MEIRKQVRQSRSSHLPWRPMGQMPLSHTIYARTIYTYETVQKPQLPCVSYNTLFLLNSSLFFPANCEGTIQLYSILINLRAGASGTNGAIIRYISSQCACIDITRFLLCEKCSTFLSTVPRLCSIYMASSSYIYSWSFHQSRCLGHYAALSSVLHGI